MSRMFWLSGGISILLSACVLGDGYTYKPHEQAFSVKRNVESHELRLDWSPEWNNWAKSNHVHLIGFFATSEGCATSEKPYTLQDGAYISANDMEIRIRYENGKSVGIACDISPKKILLYPKYSPKGFDSEEWAKPTEIRFD